MSGRKNSMVALGLVVAASLLASAATALFSFCHFSRLQFQLLNAVCQEAAQQGPEAERVMLAALKGYTDKLEDGTAKEYTSEKAECGAEDSILWAFGYRSYDFLGPAYRGTFLFAAAGLLTGVLLFAVTFLFRNKMEAVRIQALAGYLEQVNNGKAAVLSVSGEDDFSKLEDEIYKTVTYLYQTKGAAVQAKNGFAENLSNIAHQIKTPITAISLSVQMIKQEIGSSLHFERVEKQVLRLAQLEEALLVLSRMDAGTLCLQKDEVDVYTVLVLAADNLQELFASSGTSIDIPQLGGMMVVGDLEWTMEAVMNLMKNCIEHGNGGMVHCSYEKIHCIRKSLSGMRGKGLQKRTSRTFLNGFTGGGMREAEA